MFGYFTAEQIQKIPDSQKKHLKSNKSISRKKIS